VLRLGRVGGLEIGRARDAAVGGCDSSAGKRGEVIVELVEARAIVAGVRELRLAVEGRVELVKIEELGVGEDVQLSVVKCQVVLGREFLGGGMWFRLARYCDTFGARRWLLKEDMVAEVRQACEDAQCRG